MKTASRRVLILILFCTVALSAHSQSPPSLAADSSFGLIQTSLDAALQAGEFGFDPGFSELGGSLIAGGLGNLNGFAARSDHTATEENPGYFGWYVSGAYPFSLSVSFASDSQTDPSIEDSVALEYTEVSDSPTADTDATYRWVSRRTETSYAVKQADRYSLSAGYLQHIGPINIGLSLSGFRDLGDLSDPAGWAARNQTVVERFNYDAQADSPPPEARLDYTITTSSTDPMREMGASVSIPIFAGSGKIGNGFTASASYLNCDYSQANTVTSSEPVTTGPVDGTLTDSSDSTTDTLSSWSFGGIYELSVIRDLASGNRGLISATLGGAYDMNLIEPLVSSSSQKSYAVDMGLDAGSRKVLDSSSSETATSTRAIQDWYRIHAGGGYASHIDLGDHFLRFGPEIEATYSNRPQDGVTPDTLDESAVTTRYVHQTGADADGDGVFEQTIKTTREYQVHAVPLHEEIGVDLSIPVVLNLELTDRVGLILGSRPMITWTRTRIRNADVQLIKETIDELDANGELVRRETTEVEPEAIGGLAANRLFSECRFVTSQRLALNLRFPEEIRLDVVLNWNNLFDIDDLTIQAVVPLP